MAGSGRYRVDDFFSRAACKAAQCVCGEFSLFFISPDMKIKDPANVL